MVTMIRTFSEEMLGLPGHPKPVDKRKEFSESGPAEQNEKQMLHDVQEGRREFFSKLIENPIKFAQTCNSSLQLMNMDGDDYASTVGSQTILSQSGGSQTTSGHSSAMDLRSSPSSVDEARIARILQEYEASQLNSSGDDDDWVIPREDGRRVSFDLGEYLYM